MSKFRMLCLAAAFALSAHAASPMKKADMGGVSGWGVGFGAHTSPSSGVLQLDYKGPSHETGFSVSARMEDANDDANDVNFLSLGFHVGAREMIKPMLAVSGGFNAATELYSQKNFSLDGQNVTLNNRPYRVGFYSALSYEPTKYVSMWARNDLISYARSGIDARGERVSLFGNTQLGLSYYWQN